MKKRELQMSNIEKIFNEYGTHFHYEVGQRIMEKGAPANLVFYIQSGTVRAYCTNPEGEEITLHYVGFRNIIGLESIVPEATFFNDGDAVTPMDVLTLSAARFMQIWLEKRYPLNELIEQYLQKIYSLQDIICCSHYRDSSQKVAYFLYSQCCQFGPHIFYSNDQIASLIGLKRISVNRILNNFSKEGLISLGYRKIQVLNPDKLMAVFHSVGYLIS